MSLCDCFNISNFLRVCLFPHLEAGLEVALKQDVSVSVLSDEEVPVEALKEGLKTKTDILKILIAL